MNQRIARAARASQSNHPPNQMAAPPAAFDRSPRALHHFARIPIVAPAVQRCPCQDKQDQQSPSPPVQFKLTVNTPGDSYEQEADATADRVLRMSAPSEGSLVQRQARPEEEELQMKPLPGAGSSFLQRRCSCEDEAQRTEAGGEDLATADVSGVVAEGLSGGGRPLDAATRAFMEPRFGHDFSQVRIHDSAQASSSAQAVSARAYTVGSSIAFRSGEFSPGSSEGRRLLAHELTHVVQQGASSPLTAGVQRSLWVSQMAGLGVQRDDGTEDDPTNQSTSTDPDAGAPTDADAPIAGAPAAGTPAAGTPDGGAPSGGAPDDQVVGSQGDGDDPDPQPPGDQQQDSSSASSGSSGSGNGSGGAGDGSAPPPGASCKVDVRATHIGAGGLLSNLPVWHTFIVYTDPTGKEFYYRGGPTPGAAGGGYGNIITESGEYTAGTVDFPSSESKTVMEGSDACGKDACLAGEMVRIQGTGTAYQPTGPNSNTTTHTALGKCGIPQDKPVSIAPGWGDPDL